MDKGMARAKELQKQEAEYPRLSRWSRYYKIAWTVVRNALYLWLIYLAFGRMQSIFETLVLAVLILVLQLVVSTVTMTARSFEEEAYFHRSLFLGLYKKFNDPEVQEGEEGLRGLQKEHHKQDVFLYINAFAIYVAYWYVLWKIIKALVLS
jgi:hypothetical protein